MDENSPQKGLTSKERAFYNGQQSEQQFYGVEVSAMTQQTLTMEPAADPTPDFFHYPDTGCEVSPSCLDCPLPQCKFDDLEWYHQNRRLARDFQVLAVMELENLTAEAAAARFAVTTRTIFRIVERCRKASPAATRYAQAINYGEEQLALAA